MSGQRPDNEQRERMDWSEIHQKLDRIEELIGETGESVEGERAQAILHRRAENLARLDARTVAMAGEQQRAIGFRLGGERFAVEVERVEEVFQLSHLTSVPGVPDFVAGVVNARGHVMPVVDLVRFFDLAPNVGIADLTKVLVISDGTDATGILIETLDAVREFYVDDLQPTPVVTPGLAGVFPEGEDLITLLDVPTLLRGLRDSVGARDPVMERES